MEKNRENTGAACPGKALIAMSGGVDSSVAALLMRRQGWACVGCTMKLHDREAPEGGCCSLSDVEDARAVARKLGFPYYVFNFESDFRRKVIDKFVQSYQCGRTPNPCIDCNRYLKFERLYHRAKELGCDCIVTGHYARVERAGDRYLLKKALDETKDQSYVLYALTQDQLAHTRFPLGALRKNDTRRIAEENGLITAQKPDSQDICFVPGGDYAKVIEEYTGVAAEPGDFVATGGRVLGRHKGIIHYTVGQRKGLGLALPAPLYVCRVEPETNRVVLGTAEELMHDTLRVPVFHWIAGEAPPAPVRCRAKIRYRQQEQPCTAYPEGEGVRIVFDSPQRAITPGQAAVLYDGDTVLGGGEID